MNIPLLSQIAESLALTTLMTAPDIGFCVFASSTDPETVLIIVSFSFADTIESLRGIGGSESANPEQISNVIHSAVYKKFMVPFDVRAGSYECVVLFASTTHKPKIMEN
jgi:hypothetical protein